MVRHARAAVIWHQMCRWGNDEVADQTRWRTRDKRDGNRVGQALQSAWRCHLVLGQKVLVHGQRQAEALSTALVLQDKPFVFYHAYVLDALCEQLVITICLDSTFLVFWRPFCHSLSLHLHLQNFLRRTTTQSHQTP